MIVWRHIRPGHRGRLGVLCVLQLPTSRYEEPHPTSLTQPNPPQPTSLTPPHSPQLPHLTHHTSLWASHSHHLTHLTPPKSPPSHPTPPHSPHLTHHISLIPPHFDMKTYSILITAGLTFRKVFNIFVLSSNKWRTNNCKKIFSPVESIDRLKVWSLKPGETLYCSFPLPNKTVRFISYCGVKNSEQMCLFHCCFGTFLLFIISLFLIDLLRRVLVGGWDANHNFLMWLCKQCKYLKK